MRGLRNTCLVIAAALMFGAASDLCAQIIPTATVTGTVRDAFTGAVVPGATVSYIRKLAITNAAGVYTIAGIACSFAGPFNVTMIQYQPFSQTYIPPVCGVNTKNVAISPLTSFSGRVTSSTSGNAVVGATLTWRGNTATTDSAGNYAFTNILCGTASNIVISKSGYNTLTQSYAPPCQSNSSIFFALTPNASITGTIRDPYGSFPVAGATVSFRGITFVTGAAGTYAFLGIACGAGTFAVTAPSYQTYSVAFTPTCAGSDVKDVALQPLTTFTGTVTDSVSGSPISGATVTWGSSTTATNAAGFYSFLQVACGTSNLAVSKAGYQSFSQSYTPDCYPPPSGSAPKNIQMQPLVSISGTIKDVRNGASISGATVTWGSNSTSSNASGGYTFTNVICQTAPLTVTKTGYQTSTQSYTPTCLTANTKDVSLQPLTSFSGRVTDASTNAAIGGASVGWGSFNTLTNANGIYAFTNVACDTATLTVAKSGYQSFSQAYTPACLSSSVNDISLSPIVTTGTINGTVRDAVSNATISGATVTFAGLSATTDSGGTYSLTSISCGQATLTVVATGYQSYSAPYTPATCPGVSTQNIQLQPNAATFSGVVATANRSPVAGAVVTWSSFSTTTNAIGLYRFANVACQTATLTVSKSGFQPFSETYTPACFGSSIKDVPLTVAAGATCSVAMSAPAVTQSGVEYVVSWTAAATPNTPYVVDEATSRDFTVGVRTQTVNGLSMVVRHDVVNTTTYYYRAKPVTCSGTPITFSSFIATVVQAVPPPQLRNLDTVVPLGSTTPVSRTILIPAPAGKDALDTNFTATTDKTFLAVSPASGTIPPEGLTLTVTARPERLPPGANTGTIKVLSSTGAQLSSVPVSISLVTPVTHDPKNFPPQNALIIPVVTHVNGAAGPFLSDVRLTNLNDIAVNYELTFTPTESDGTKVGSKTTIAVDPAQTIALNDIANDFFGFGASGSPTDTGFGALEIRPINTSSLLTFASSRTYASTADGTFGQFIAAVPFSNLATRLFGATAPPVLSFQQIAESARFRTNVGIIEAAGQAANGRLRIFNNLGVLLKEVSYDLLPGQHRQMNRFISANGIANLDDGRIEITVDSETGAVSGYASVLDNITSDPLAVMPVQVANVSASAYTLPGMADLPTGANNFHSDIRIYNGGAISVPVTITFYPQANPAAKVSAAPFTIGSGQVAAIDNVLPALFGATPSAGRAGSIVVRTFGNSSLVTTGRTYSLDSRGGTFGQFIPGVTPADGIGAGNRPLQLLQLEQSQNFRTNLGLAELTGNSVHLRISVVRPESKVAGIVEWDLQANEFVQLGRIIESVFGSGSNTYNARISIEVTGGTGRVSAYGSVIDNSTQDPTYVPAQ